MAAFGPATMFDQNPNSQFGVYPSALRANGTISAMADFLSQCSGFINSPTTGRAAWILRTDFTVEAFPKIDEAVTGKMSLLYFEAMATAPYVR